MSRERDGARRAPVRGLLAASLAILSLGGVRSAEAQLAGDSCLAPVPVQAGVTVFFDNSRAGSDAAAGCPMQRDLWFEFTPAASGPASFSTCGSFFASALAVYDAHDCPAEVAVPLGCAPQGCDGGAPLTLSVVAGHGYLVRVGSTGSAGGAGQLLVTAACAALEQFICAHDAVRDELVVGWAGDGPYAFFQVYLDGVLVDMLPGSATTFISSGLTPGTHSVQLVAICVSGGELTRTCEVTVAPALSRFRRGDCQQDGAVNLSDAVFLMLSLQGLAAPGTCLDACDVNADGHVSLGDAVTLLARLFLGAGPLPPPQLCGSDTAQAVLGCAAPSGCP